MRRKNLGVKKLRIVFGGYRCGEYEKKEMRNKQRWEGRLNDK